MLQLQPLFIPSQELLQACGETQIFITHSGGKVQHSEHSACREGTQCCSSHRASETRKLQRSPEGLCCAGSDATGGTGPHSVWHQICSSVPSPQSGGLAYAQEVRLCCHHLHRSLVLHLFWKDPFAPHGLADLHPAGTNLLSLIIPKQACISSVGACCVSQRLVDIQAFAGFLGKAHLALSAT